MSNLTTKLELNQKGLDKIRNEGVLDCYDLGFKSFQENILVSRKYPVFIAGEPHHGKSTFLFEILLQLSEIYGLKHFCYFGEEGNPDEVFAQLCSMYIGKPFSKVYGNDKKAFNPMTDLEFNESKIFINDHFYILPVSETLSVDEFYEELERSQEDYGVKYDCAVLDPIYDLSDFEAKEKYINTLLKKVKNKCYESNRIDFVINHTSETYSHYDRKENKKISVPATPEQWYGGKVWSRRAFLQLLVHRPTPDEDVESYIPDNQTNIIVQKAKPRGIGKLGVFNIYFDFKKQRYYERVNNELKFSRKSKNENKEALENPINFKPTTEEVFGDDVPF